MLYYTQVKREFTHASWRRGQVYFREERIANVKLNEDESTISARVRGTGEDPYDTEILMKRGTIARSKCNCPAHKQYEKHCKHVAALAVWVVERGSLLRSGVSAGEYGVASSEDDEVSLRDPQKAMTDPALRKLLLTYPVLARSRFAIRKDPHSALLLGKDISTGRSFSIPVTLFEVAAILEHCQTDDEESKNSMALEGEPVLLVRGVIQGKALYAVEVESGLRYPDPVTGKSQVNTLTYLSRQPETGLWKTNHGILLKVPNFSALPDDQVNFIQKLDTSRTTYRGQQALENLAKLLTHKLREHIVFDSNVNVKVEEIPLKLVALKIGKKIGDTRELSYEYRNKFASLTSEDLQELSRLGRLSNHYVWKGDRIFKLETSLNQLRQYTQQQAMNADEKGDPSELKGLSDQADNPLHPIAAYRLSLELGVENFQVDEDWEEYREWKKKFDMKKIPKLPATDYGFDLREYQQNGLSWIWSLYHRSLAALLADDMGLGKTHQVLAFLTSVYRSKKTRPERPTLVVAPTSVIAAWQQKLQKYDTRLKWHVYHGSGRVFPKSGVDIILTTYGILHREPVLRETEWHIVVLDEAQAIKNAQTISSRASRLLKSQFRIAMTGTPVENQSTDLWSLLEFLLPGYLGSLTRFKKIYGWGRENTSDLQSAALRRLISPFLLRRTKSQVLKELPEKTEEVISCEMTAAQKKAYRDCLNSAEAAKVTASLVGGGKVDYANVLALLTRLKQVCDHPKLPAITAKGGKLPKTLDPAESGKWEVFDELVSEAIGSNLKVVVFTQYLSMMDMVGRYLTEKGIGYTDLRGDTSDRGARIQKFSSDPECKVFVCSLLAGGLGIDLTAGSVCIHFDRWWNPARENQATDRLHRYGQTRGVQVFKLQIQETVEDRIASIIQSKARLSDALVEESSLGLKAFSREELLSLLSPVN